MPLVITELHDNHSVAYCLLSYLCAYYRYYHPVEFITAFLNNAANEEDIRNGSTYAAKAGVRITMPKWGFSRSDYAYDSEKRIIAKGLMSIKYIGSGLAEELYEIARDKHFTRFIDVLIALDQCTSMDRRQLDILIKIDFFSEFGNQRELLRIVDIFYITFKKGQAKKISKEIVDGTPLEPIIQKYSVGVTKSGGVAKSYTLLDVVSIMQEAEDAIKAMQISDLSDSLKVRNFADVMGYAGYVSGKAEDRPKLYVMEVYPLVRKADSTQFGYSVITKSIGSGKESRFTVINKVYDKDPIQKGDIVFCKNYTQNGKYFRLNDYYKVY